MDVKTASLNSKPDDLVIVSGSSGLTNEFISIVRMTESRYTNCGILKIYLGVSICKTAKGVVDTPSLGHLEAVSENDEEEIQVPYAGAGGIGEQ